MFNQQTLNMMNWILSLNNLLINVIVQCFETIIKFVNTDQNSQGKGNLVKYNLQWVNENSKNKEYE
jgi:hypothetical protein